MEGRGAESVRKRMETLRGICDREVPFEIHRMDSTATSYCKSLDSIKIRAEDTIQNRMMLGKMKDILREAEDEFVEVFSRLVMRQSRWQQGIPYMLQELESRSLIKLGKFRALGGMSTQQFCPSRLQHLKERENRKMNIDKKLKRQYYGVKFTFNNVNAKNPHEEYSFTVHHENDTYTLLACDPSLRGTNDLILELNRTNGLFKFVRTIREKFKEAASLGQETMVAKILASGQSAMCALLK